MYCFSNSDKTFINRIKLIKKNPLPEYPRHGMSSSVVEGGVVLVRLPIRGVGVQRLFKLRVALVELVGEHLVSVDERLAKLGGYVPHRSAPSTPLCSTLLNAAVNPASCGS